MRLGFDTAEAFELGYRRFVTAQGIFLASRTPRPVGSSLRFELQTRDGTIRLLVAEGRVVGVRPADPEFPRRVPGMHVRFTRLTEESRLRVYRMSHAVGATAGPRATQPSMSAVSDAVPDADLATGGAPPDDPATGDGLRPPTPAAVDLALQAELRPIGDPVPTPPEATAASEAGLDSMERLEGLDLPDPDSSPFKNIFERLFGMGGGEPPTEDPFDLFPQADLPTADGDPLEDVPELPPNAILR
jgi:hypothetical protein